MDYVKQLKRLERKLFPHDSLYQRSRRRVTVFFGVLGAAILVYGTAKIMTKFSNRTERTADYQKMLSR